MFTFLYVPDEKVNYGKILGVLIQQLALTQASDTTSLGGCAADVSISVWQRTKCPLTSVDRKDESKEPIVEVRTEENPASQAGGPTEPNETTPLTEPE